MHFAVPERDRIFRRYSVWILFYSVFVILWGAFVRASLSGDGCGDHWPLCDGELLPSSPSFQKAVEFLHRTTSGLAWIACGVGFLGARLWFKTDDVRRTSSGWVLFFMTTEALIGAGLVLLEMVAQNQVQGRAWWMAAHLSNTFLLLGAMCWQTWSSFYPAATSRGFFDTAVQRWIALACASLVAISITGALAALGDTLYLGTDFGTHLSLQTYRTAPPLIQARLLHPLTALLGAAIIVTALGYTVGAETSVQAHRIAIGCLVCVILQLGIGATNVALLAPAWLQIVHLFFADLLWIGLIFLALERATAHRTALWVREPSRA
ncbi:MAG: COX15/CtaA family protein [Myxococcota bacterium]